MNMYIYIYESCLKPVQDYYSILPDKIHRIPTATLRGSKRHLCQDLHAATARHFPEAHGAWGEKNCAYVRGMALGALNK